MTSCAIALGNGGVGISTWNGQNNLIGGTVPGAGNVIASNGYRDVFINASPGPVVIQGNYIGTNKTGNVPMGNLSSGFGIDVEWSSNVQIGGTAPGAGNVIGNHQAGIGIAGTGSTSNLIQGNSIGVGADGVTAIPNDFGVWMFGGASNNTIGGTAPGAGNVIADNNAVGILLSQYYLAPIATGNAILGNSIYDNISLAFNDTGLGGIDINRMPDGQSVDGPNPNDLGDADVGNNNLQNYPVLTNVINGLGSTNIQGTLNSTPNSTFRVEFFSNTTVDPSGYGEGEHYLGFKNVTTDANGNASFNVTLATASTAGQFITSTATDSANNTSEFSLAYQAVAYVNHPATITGTATGKVVEDAVPNSVSGSLVVSDSDAGEAAAVVQTGTSGAYGSFSVNASGTWTYTLNNSLSVIQSLAVGQHLTETFSVTSADGTASQDVTITIAGSNDAPVAGNDSVSTTEDAAVTFGVLGNDHDIDTGDILTVTSFTNPAHGNLALNSNGTFTYRPGATCDSSGGDSFAYTISDGHGGTATGTVTIGINQAVANGAISIDGSGVVRISGGAGNDTIALSSGGGHLLRNGVDTGIALGAITEIRIWGRGGNDVIDVSALNIKSFISGGNGDDVITGGEADDVLLGGSGNDTITGGAENDFLIGGTGADRLVGSAGNDILVADDLECGLDLAMLRAIANAWNQSRSATNDVVDDAVDEAIADSNADKLTGSAGADLFIINSEDQITDFQFGKPKTNKDGDVVFRNGVVAL